MQKLLLFITAILLIILTSCWDEFDTITFNKDGTIKFESKISINDTSFKSADIEMFVKTYADELIKDKWQVQWKWVNKSRPFEVIITGSGNIKTIADSSSFYTFEKLPANKYAWQFNKSLLQGPQNRRIINIPEGSLMLKNSNGKIVKSIISESSGEKYILDLN